MIALIGLFAYLYINHIVLPGKRKFTVFGKLPIAITSVVLKAFDKRSREGKEAPSTGSTQKA